MKSQFYSSALATEELFGEQVELLPSVTELFELELAHLEYKAIQDSDFLDRTAFFKSVNGKSSKHFLLCSEKPDSFSDDRSAKTKAYFENGQFSTGYATHGLFPYRGKFHPQLIKGLLNILGVKKGETILDPMCGSGTANIEAAMMGINSYGIDVSPFCQFMTRTKYEALTIDVEQLSNLKKGHEKLFDFLKDKKKATEKISSLTSNKAKVYNLSLLAFLDALGYSKRVTSSTHQQLFEKVLKRYVNTVEGFLNNSHFDNSQLGWVEVLPNSEALKIDLPNDSIDAIITSPPYSFAIDYAANDQDQLEYLGYDTNELKSRMIGLKGRYKSDKLENYFTDMGTFCSEVAMVLKKGKHFVMIIGSNTNQTGGIRLEQTVIDSAKKVGLELVKSIIKPIKGMRNTMKDEYILFFERK
ncbi:MAG: hypothetical protein FVQ77_03320 [Cytophagales bacterium]|nr:hypothetical protein [Cytophagales bacterium]